MFETARALICRVRVSRMARKRFFKLDIQVCTKLSLFAIFRSNKIMMRTILWNLKEQKALVPNVKHDHKIACVLVVDQKLYAYQLYVFTCSSKKLGEAYVCFKALQLFMC